MNTNKRLKAGVVKMMLVVAATLAVALTPILLTIYCSRAIYYVLP